MYACLCRAVTEQAVREAVAAGAVTLSEVRSTCGAGTGCHGCLPSLRRLLRECREAASANEATRAAGYSELLGPAHPAWCEEVVGYSG